MLRYRRDELRIEMRLLSLIATLGLAGCGSSRLPAFAPLATGDAVQFVAFGDAGTGSAAQRAVGEAMAQLCATRGCGFALELGDNFYTSGVESVDDAQWQSKFEIPFQNLKVPVFAALGNHDNSSGPGEGSNNRRGEVQVKYHYLAGRTSNKWNMPARYYHFTVPADTAAPLVEFFALDSNPFAANVPDASPRYALQSYGRAHQDWFIEKLRSSRARWKVAFAHHPYISNGGHGNAGTADGQPQGSTTTTSAKPWKDFIEATGCQYGLDLFLFGHDHELEWLKPTANCPRLQHVMSGAAARPRAFGDAHRNPAYWQEDSKLGFWWFRIRGDTLTGAAYVLDEEMKLPLDGAGVPVSAFEQSLTRAP